MSSLNLLPPGPRGRLKTTYQIMRDPLGTYERMQREWGDLFTLRAMNGTVIVTCTPEGARAVFATRSEDTRAFGVEALRPLLGDRSLFTLHGKDHHRERRLIMPAFHGPRMKAYGSAIQRIARERIAGWSPGEAIVVQEEMLQITFRVIIHAVFGVTEPERVKRYVAAVTGLVRTIRPVFLFFKALQLPFLPQWRSFVAAINALDELLYEDIAASRARGGVGEDVLSLLVASRYEDDASEMEDTSIRDELVTLLFAGHETTAIALALCVARLHRHPEAREWLAGELENVGDAPEELVTCKALGAFWKETLRLDVIVPDVLRTLEKDLQIGGQVIPAGLHVGVLISRIHSDPEIFPEPAAFRPERFVERRFSPFEYMPFGGGVRRCIGSALATYEMELVLAELMAGPRLRVVSQDRLKRRNAVMGPSEGVRAVVEPA